MYIFPEGSHATPCGLLNDEVAAGPLAEPTTPDMPATRLTVWAEAPFNKNVNSNTVSDLMQGTVACDSPVLYRSGLKMIFCENGNLTPVRFF